MQKCCGSVYHKLDTYNFSLLPLYVISTCPQGRHLTFPNLLKATFQWSDAMLCHGNKSDRWSAKSCWPLLGTLCSLKICWEESTVHPKWKIDAWKKKKFSWVLLCKAIKNQLARKCCEGEKAHTLNTPTSPAPLPTWNKGGKWYNHDGGGGWRGQSYSWTETLFVFTLLRRRYKLWRKRQVVDYDTQIMFMVLTSAWISHFSSSTVHVGGLKVMNPKEYRGAPNAVLSCY